MRDAPARQEEISPAIARDESCNRRMILFTQPHDDVLERCDTLAIKVEDGPTQHLGQIEHCLDSLTAKRNDSTLSRAAERGVSTICVSRWDHIDIWVASVLDP